MTTETKDRVEDLEGQLKEALNRVETAEAQVEKWAIRPEMERDASLRGTEVVVTSAYAVGEVDDLAGQGLIFDR